MARVCFIGNIAAGKTKLIQALMAEYFKESYFLYEPVKEWMKHDLLELYGKDPTKYSLALQVVVSCTLFRDFINMKKIENKANFIFQERDLFDAMEAFTPILERNKHLEEYESFALHKLKEALEQIYEKPDAYIYLRISPSLAHERSIARGEKWDMKHEGKVFEDIGNEYEKYVKKIKKPLLQLNSSSLLEENVLLAKNFIKSL